MPDSPLISVVMPVFNSARYLSQAVESILAQTERGFEFLIFDDGSTDGSWDLLTRYATSDPRIQLRRGEHRGYSQWLNEGIDIARGTFIARMDSDDIALPDRFAVQLAFLQHHPDVVAVGGRVLAIDSDGDPIYPWLLPLTHEQIDSDNLVARPGGLVHPATMIRRQALIDIGGYRTELEPAEDLDLWLRLAERGRLANVPQQVLHYREHLASVSLAKRERQTEHARRAISEARTRRGLPPFTYTRGPLPPVTELLRTSFWHSWGAGYHRTSRKCARRLVRLQPWSLANWALLARAYSPLGIRHIVRKPPASDAALPGGVVP